MIFMDRADEVSDLGPENFLHWNRFSADHMHVEVPGAERGSDLQADEAGANDDSALCRHGGSGDFPAVRERAQIMNVRKAGAGDIELHRLSPGCEKQGVVGVAAAIGQRHLPAGNIDRRHLSIEMQIDFPFAVELGRPQRNPALGRAPGQIVFRKIGPVAGQVRVGAEHRDPASEAFAAKRFRRGITRRPTANDEDRCWHFGRIVYRGLRRRFQSLANIDRPEHFFDAPAWKRITRGGAGDAARAQVETGMMPGATDRVVDKKPATQRRTIMGAKGADGEQVAFAANQQHRLTAGMPLQHRIFWERRKGDARCEVRPGKLRRVGAHSNLLRALHAGRGLQNRAAEPLGAHWI